MRKLIIAFVLISTSTHSFATTTATPSESAYWNMNRAISGVTQKALESRGYVASDPRTYNTLSQMSGAAKVGLSSAGGAAAGIGVVTFAGATAPAWASVALFIGVSSVVSYGISLALDGLVNWLFRSDNKIDAYGNTIQVATSTSMNVGGAYCRVSFVSSPHNIQISGGDCEAIARQGHSQYMAVASPGNTSPASCTVTANYVQCGVIYAQKFESGAPANCVAGTYYQSGTCKNYSFTSPSSVPSKSGIPIGTAVADLPASELDKALNPQVVAALANRLWQSAAAQPNYSGIPYQQTNPITAEEAVQWQQANPQAWPTVRQFVQPRTDYQTNADTTSLPQNATQVGTIPSSFTTSPNPTSINPSSNQQAVNLGPDPVTPTPNLEGTPTAQMILSPILDLLPDLRSFSAPSNSGVCPRPSIDLWDKNIILDGHCDLLDNNAAAIQAVMALVWVLLAMFIVLAA